MPYVLSLAIAASLLMVAASVASLLGVRTYALWLTHVRPVRAHPDEARAYERNQLSMPASVTQLVAEESEEWARTEVHDEALRLHGLLEGDWERVELELRRRYHTPDMRASERVWSAAGAGESLPLARVPGARPATLSDLQAST